MSSHPRVNHIKREIQAIFGNAGMQYVWLSLITLLAAALRFYRLGEWSFWIDELYTVNHAMAHFSTPQLILDHIPPARNWVPVSVILTAQALNIWGVSEWSARLASVVIGVTSLPLLYFPARRLFGHQVALLAILLLAVSPWHIFWSQNARFYSSLLLFYTLALFAFQEGIEQDKPGYLLAFFILLYFAVSERLSALFIYSVIFGYLVALGILRFDKPKGMNFRNLLILGLPLLIGGSIEVYNRVMQGESRFFADFNWFFLYRNDDPIRLLGNISFDIGIPLMGLALFSGLFRILRKDRAGLLMTVNAVIPLVMLAAATPFIFTKDRYIFVVLFSWVLLAAAGVRELFFHATGHHKWLALGVLAILLAGAAGDLLLYYRANHGNRAEWKTAFTMIQEQSQPGDVVVTYWPEFKPFYLDRDFVQYEEIRVPTLMSSGKRYWFVLDAETIGANPEVETFIEKNGRLIDVRYLRTPDDFYLRIYLFDPAQPLLPSKK